MFSRCNRHVLLQALQQRHWFNNSSSILLKRSSTALQLWRRRWNSSRATTTMGRESFRFVAWYSKKLDTHPLLTKGITSGMIAGTGDFICQYLIDKREKERALTGEGSTSAAAAAAVAAERAENGSILWWWDAWRTARFGTLGALYVGPGCHYWYGALAARYPLVSTASTTVVLAKRVGWDQYAFTPIFLVGWMTLLWTMERGIAIDTTATRPISTSESIPNRLVQSLPDILVANWVRVGERERECNLYESKKSSLILFVGRWRYRFCGSQSKRSIFALSPPNFKS
jgi:hypothetical protein